MPRTFAVERFGPEDLSFLFPPEIIGRLEMIAKGVGVDLDSAPRQAIPPVRGLDALDDLVNGFFLPAIAARNEPLSQGYDRLPRELQLHLNHLLYSAREAARALQATQPDTPLGFPRGPQGMLSNLLSASWIDLTQGGAVPVKFEPGP
ncbi:hypothetical protein [Geobacter sp.]|uniref:hypothetical protein n=1 Tax=Geobacter sp. TaxID=46610 RepID=UPI002608A8F5|nr:hypothetical protein [Geobacter sp.]